MAHIQGPSPRSVQRASDPGGRRSANVKAGRTSAAGVRVLESQPPVNVSNGDWRIRKFRTVPT